MKTIIKYCKEQMVPAQTRREERTRVIKFFSAVASLFAILLGLILNTDVSTPVFVVALVASLGITGFGLIHSVI